MHLEISATCKEIYCLSETYMQAKWFEIFPLGYWCNLSIALKNLNRLEEAISSFNKAIKINPNGFREYDARWVYEKDIC